MNTQIVFTIDPKIKARAMKRARREGLPFASVLKFATKAFADGRLSVGLTEEILPSKMRLLERESRLLDQGKGVRLNSIEAYRAFVDGL